MIPLEHFKISSHMMRQRRRLRFLHMCKSRHDRVNVLLHDLQKLPQKIHHQSLQGNNLTPDIHLHIQCHLVIPAAPGVEHLTHIPDPLDQIRLHKTVYIFIFICNLKSAALHIAENTFQTCNNFFLLFLKQDSLLTKHHHMGDTSLNILFVKPFVE